MSDDINIDDDGFDSFDDFDAPDFGDVPGGGNETRTPVTAAASSFTQAATSDLLSVNAAQRVLRKGLPEGYGKSVDLIDDVAAEASDLYDKAEKRLEPAIKSTKEATRALLPKAEGILPKKIYEKIASWADDDGSRGPNVNADEETISSSLNNIFTSQMEQQEQDKQESTIKDTLKGQVAGIRHEQSTKQLGLIQQAMSRLVGYQDSITAAYQKKSLDLQFRHYFAARDLLKVTTASNADVITALNDIKTNTGLPDWIKTQNSENFQAMLQERLMGGTADKLSDYMSNFRGNLVKGLKEKVMTTVGEVGDTVTEMANGASELAGMSDMMAEMNDGPAESTSVTAAGFVGDMAGGTLSKKLTDLMAKALKKEGSKSKFIAEKGLAANNFVNGLDGNLKEFIDGADNRDGLMGIIGKFLKDAAPVLKVRPDVLNNLSEDATKSVEWDLLSRRTLIDIIPEYLARISQSVETMATGKPAEKMVYSKLSEQMVTEGEAISEATTKFVKRGDITDYRDKNEELLNKLFGDAPISKEARAVMSEQVHNDLSKGWNMDPRRYVASGAFEGRFDPDAVAELQAYFKKQFNATDVGTDGKQDWNFDLNQKQEKLIGSLQASGKQLRDTIPDMQSAINEFVKTGDKDLLRSSGWIDNSSGKDEFNQERMSALMSGRLSLDDLQSEWDAGQLQDERKGDATKWRDTDRNQWQSDVRVEEAGQTVLAEQSNTPFKLSGKDADVMANLTKVIGQMGGNNANQLEHLAKIVTGNSEQYTVSDSQLKVLIEMRDLLQEQQASGLSSEDSIMGAELLRRFNTMGENNGPGIMSQIGSKLMGAGKMGTGALGSYYSALGTGAGKILGAGKEVGVNALNFITKKSEDLDVYIAGLKTPALRGAFIKAGRYLDVNSGKVITSLKDISGPVKDLSTGTLVLSMEDFQKGIFSDAGESLMDKFGAGAKGLVTGSMDMLGGYYSTLFNAANGAKDWLMNKATGIDRKMKAATDVYVKSRMADGPILLRTKLLRGEYFNKAGDPIYSVADIDGPVYDDGGNQLLSDEDISSGLVDPEGNKIEATGLFGAGLGLAGMGIKLATDMGAKAFKGLKSYYSGLGEAGSSLMDRLSGLFGDTLSGDVENMSVNATNVYINGVIREGDGTSPAKDSSTAMPDAVNKAADKVSEVGRQVKESAERASVRASDITDKVINKVSTATDEVVTKVTDFRDNDLDRVVEETKQKAESTINDLKDKATGLKQKVKDKLVGAELGEDSTLVKDAKGNVSIKSGDDTIPAGDGSVKGYMAALLAYFHSKDNKEVNDSDGDGLRDGGWRSKLFGKKGDTSEEGTEEKSEGAKKPSKGMLSSLAGMFGLGGGDDDGDDSSLMGDIGSEVAGEVIGDKISGKNKGVDTKTRTKGKGGKIKRAWEAISSSAKKAKGAAKGVGKKGLLGGALAGLAGVGSLFSSASGGVAGKMATSSGIKKAALWGLKGALGLVGGVLGSPILGTALAVAGATYTAYEVFGFFKDRAGVEQLEEYRYAQYGLDSNDRSHRSFLRKIEAEAIDKVVYKGSEGTINTLEITDFDFHEDMMAVVGIDPDVPYDEDPENAKRFAAYNNWFKNRFRPVFLLHHGIARMLDKSVDLLDIDDELDDSKKSLFADKAYYANDGSEASPYFQSDSPMEDHVATIGYEQINSLRDAIMADFPEEKEGGEKSFLSKFASVALSATPIGAAMAMTTAFSEKSSDGKERGFFDKLGSGLVMAIPGVALGKSLFDLFGDEGNVVIATSGVKDSKGNEVSLLDALRFHQYGVYTLTERSSTILYSLEASVYRDIIFTGGRVEYVGSFERVWKEVSRTFGYTKKDLDAKSEWRQWFRLTFLPTFGTYVLALHKLGTDDIFNPKLNNVDCFKVATALTTDFDAEFEGEWMFGIEAEENDDRVELILDSLEAKSKVKDKEIELTVDSPKKVPLAVNKVKSPEVDPAIKADTESKTRPRTPTTTTVKRKVKENKVSGKDGFILPANGKVSSPWGNRKHPISNLTEFHGGIDIAGPEGTEIVASSGGVISRREHSRKLGYVIHIDNDDGTQSRYAHLSRFEPNLRMFDRVEQGALIGYMGSTGNSTGSHLHFEVRKDAYDRTSVIDPSTLFKGTEASKVRDEIAAVVASKEAMANEKNDENNFDSDRKAQVKIGAPTVKPELMVPTAQAIGGSGLSYAVDDVAVIDTVEPTVRQPMMTSPINPTKQVSIETAANEVGVLQQRRAQLSQETANNLNEKQLDAIGQVLTEQLNSQHRMELALGEIAKNTKATANGIDVANNVIKDVPTKAEEAKVLPPPTNGASMNALFHGKSNAKVSYPLSMGRS